MEMQLLEHAALSRTGNNAREPPISSNPYVSHQYELTLLMIAGTIALRYCTVLTLPYLYQHEGLPGLPRASRGQCALQIGIVMVQCRC